SKSALFTAASLFELEQHVEGFGESLRLILGASGGMVGASVFVSYLDQVRDWEARVGKDITPEELPALKESLKKHLLARLGEDFLSPLMHRWAFYDTGWYLAGRFSYKHRGEVLQTTIDRSLNTPPENDRLRALLGEKHWLDRPLRDLAQREEAGALPSMVFSP